MLGFLKVALAQATTECVIYCDCNKALQCHSGDQTEGNNGINWK